MLNNKKANIGIFFIIYRGEGTYLEI